MKSLNIKDQKFNFIIFIFKEYVIIIFLQLSDMFKLMKKESNMEETF